MDAVDPDAGLPELCDLCGMTVADGSEVFELVPDSSSVYETPCEFDGWRLLTGCTRRHVDALAEEYRRRPFVDEEQWAARIERALNQHDGHLTTADLTTATGLAQHQIDRAVAWHNDRARRWNGRCDNEPGTT